MVRGDEMWSLGDELWATWWSRSGTMPAWTVCPDTIPDPVTAYAYSALTSGMYIRRVQSVKFREF